MEKINTLQEWYDIHKEEYLESNSYILEQPINEEEYDEKWYKKVEREEKERQRIRNAKRLNRKHKLEDAVNKHWKKGAIGAASVAGATGIAYGIKKLRDRQKQKQRLQNPETQKRLKNSIPEYYCNNNPNGLNEGWARNIGMASSISGALAAGISLYKMATSNDGKVDVGTTIRNVGHSIDNLAPRIRKELDDNIKKIYNIMPKKLIRDVMFADGVSNSGIIIINNENELCRHFASRSYNNKTNEGIIFYVLELFKKDRMNYNIITYDFFTKYYQRSLTKALTNNESNINCYNCYNSKQCEFCIDCINCISCKYCIDCINCRSLENGNRQKNQIGNSNNDVDSSQQLASKYGITDNEIEYQIGVIRRRENVERLIIKRSYQNKREQDIALAKLPKTDKEFREKAIQELINKKK